MNLEYELWLDIYEPLLTDLPEPLPGQWVPEGHGPDLDEPPYDDPEYWT